MKGIDPFVEGKKVLILGFGREGQSTLRTLLRTKAYREIGIADRREVGPETSGADADGPDPKIRWITGTGYQDVMDEYDVVWKSPGIVLERPREEYRCRILSQTEVFFHLFRDQIIGITGTKGKSTTSSLLYQILKAAGRKAVLAGNIGIPAFDLMGEIEEDTDIVFELSCHQLEYMDVSPHIGILLNIHEEHLDHYGTMERYVAAKQNIYRNQRPDDILICSSQCLPGEGSCPSRVIAAVDLGEEKQEDGVLKEAAEDKMSGEWGNLTLSGSDIFFEGARYPIPKQDIRLLGHHNDFDIAMVYGVCMLKGIGREAFTRGLASYQPLPHRLHYLGERDGVKYYDDSISTICDTAIQALNTIKDADTVLIGGMDRGIDYRDLIEYLSSSPVPHIILMEATGKRIEEEIRNGYPDFRNPERIVLTDHLEEAARQARRLTRPGKSCILSPAAASYGIFKNFEERGDAFRKLVLGR